MESDKVAETPISIRLPKTLLPKIDKLARKERRTRANYVRVILEEVVRRGGLAIQEPGK